MAVSKGLLILFYWIKKVLRKELLNSRRRGWGKRGKPFIHSLDTEVYGWYLTDLGLRKCSLHVIHSLETEVYV